MGPIDLLAVAFWPLIGLGIVLIIAAGRLPSRHRPARALVIAGLVAAAGPLGVLLIFYADYSELTRADQFSFIAILGSIVLVAAWHVEMQAIRRALCFLIGGAMFGMASWTFVGDYLVRREQIEGIVTGLHTERPGALGRHPPKYHVGIRGRSYQTTTAIFESVTVGQRIRTEVGAGSGMILAFEPIPR